MVDWTVKILTVPHALGKTGVGGRAETRVLLEA